LSSWGIIEAFPCRKIQKAQQKRLHSSRLSVFFPKLTKFEADKWIATV